MKLVEHEMNRAIRLGAVTATPDGQKLFGPALVRAVMERYSFVEGPKTVPEHDLQRGVSFKHGFFNGKVIDLFQVYNNGMFAEGKHDTDLNDSFLDDVEQWAKQSVGVALADQAGGRIYMSQLVVQSEIDLTKALAPLQQISKKITSLLNPSVDLPAEVSGIQIATDPSVSVGWIFRFERRVGAPFGAQLYFSSAPLRTEQHLMLLEHIERDFAS